MKNKIKRRLLSGLACIVALTSITGCSDVSQDTVNEGIAKEQQTSDDSITKEKTDEVVESDQQAVVLGDERFDEFIPMLSGKSVALFSNHTGIVGDEASGKEVTVGNDEASLVHFGLDNEGKEISYGEHILDALLSRHLRIKSATVLTCGMCRFKTSGTQVLISII